MVRMLALAALFATAGCNNQGLFMPTSNNATIPGEAIKGYAQANNLSPEEARRAMIADNLTTRGASLPKQAVGR